MIMKEASAYFAQGRGGFVSGQRSMPIASAWATKSANSARCSSTESWAMPRSRGPVISSPRHRLTHSQAFERTVINASA